MSEAPENSGYERAFGGHFALTDRNGQPFSEAKLKGKPFAIFFGFTRCPDVCPTSLNLMARLREKLGPDGNKFEIVFVSVDPEHDSPKTVGDYVDLFGTPIIGLTGSDQQIAKVAKSYGVYVEKVPLPGGGNASYVRVGWPDSAGRDRSIPDASRADEDPRSRSS
jgi:protein SCO1/2